MYLQEMGSRGAAPQHKGRPECGRQGRKELNGGLEGTWGLGLRSQGTWGHESSNSGSPSCLPVEGEDSFSF